MLIECSGVGIILIALGQRQLCGEKAWIIQATWWGGENLGWERHDGLKA